VQALTRVDGDATPLLREIVDVAEVALERTAGLKVKLATQLLRWDRYVDFALGLLDDAAEEVSHQAYRASDRRDLLLEASAAALDVEKGLAADLFARAIDAAHGIDDDVGLHLAVLARMAQKVSDTISSEPAKDIAERLARSLEEVTPYVSDRATSFPTQKSSQP
jgi:hypothetical protein